jgi:hypothetical protein
LPRAKTDLITAARRPCLRPFHARRCPGAQDAEMVSLSGWTLLVFVFFYVPIAVLVG